MSKKPFGKKIVSRSLYNELLRSYEVDLPPPVRVYAGSVGESKRRPHTVFYHNQGSGNIFTKTFSWGARKDRRDEAMIKALEFQKEYSDNKKLTQLRHVPVCKVRDLTATELQFAAGLIDGDGCIHIQNKISVAVCLVQVQDVGIPLMLLYMRDLFGGRIYSSRPKGLRVDGTKRRQRHVWYADHDELMLVLEACINYGMIKQKQAELAMEFACAPRNDRLESLEYVQETLYTLKHTYESIEIDPSRLTFPYIAGLFDAEGCVWIRNIPSGGLYMNIAQMSCPRLLTAIAQKYDGPTGKAYPIVYEASSNRAERFLTSILPYIKQKREQVQIALACPRSGRDFYPGVPSPLQRSQIEEAYNALRTLKVR